MPPFERAALLLGEDAIGTLAKKHVAVFGIGGVGGYVCEALARAGLGALSLFDNDTIAASNLNRQIIALRSTLGQAKVAVMAQRIADINPACAVTAHQVFYTPDNAADYPFEGYDYVVDAVDTVSAKLAIILRAKAAGVPVISSMGTGNKLHPERLELRDIYATSVCPLARVMRKELKKHGVERLRVVCSTEPPLTPGPAAEGNAPGRRSTPGSTSFVPGAAGLILAGAVVRGLLGLEA